MDRDVLMQIYGGSKAQARKTARRKHKARKKHKVKKIQRRAQKPDEKLDDLEDDVDQYREKMLEEEPIEDILRYMRKPELPLIVAPPALELPRPVPAPKPRRYLNVERKANQIREAKEDWVTQKNIIESWQSNQKPPRRVKLTNLGVGPKKLRDLKLLSGIYVVGPSGRLKLKPRFKSKDFVTWFGNGKKRGGYKMVPGIGKSLIPNLNPPPFIGMTLGGKRAPSKWQALVKKVMKERGCSLGEASKIAKKMY